MPDIRTTELKSPIDVAEYLYRRIHQVGIRSVFGVPGDYNLVALDYIPRCGLEWVGNCNELNAGYAADGYARIKGISALVTTFGVGELSAINAVAGAYSEYVPLIHIVGTPSTISQSNGMLLHHTLGNGDFKVFSDISRNISVNVALLDDASTAAGMIDEAIRECYVRSRPVYIALPTDVVQKKVEGERLLTPIDLTSPPNEEEKENYAVERILEHIQKAKNPIILVDACAIRHRALNEVHALISKSNFPTYVTPMGKGAVDESLPSYGGVYAGTGSNTGVRERVEASDLVLSIGSIKSDFNTGGFSFRLSQMTTIDFHSDYVRVRYSEYPGVRMHGVLRKVVDRISMKPSAPSSPTNPQNAIPKSELSLSQDPTITHAWLWPRFGQWLKQKDILITETGTSNFGIWQTRFPADVTAISQVLWGSIGYATPACLGAALGAKDSEGDGEGKKGTRRTVLFTGDGSFQLTAQEVSTMIRHKLNPIIFIICNDGYAIERLIHGKDEAYNSVQNWNYKDLVPAFGAQEGTYKTYQVKTKTEADDLFDDKEFASAPFLQLVEVYMPRDDAPAELKAIAASTAENNAKM